MDEDELRAFLESATVGGDAQEPESEDQEAEKAAADGDTLNLPPTEPITIPSETPQVRPERAAGEPSFDDIMGGGSAAPDRAAPDPASASRAAADQPDLTPIVLPSPPVSASVFADPTPDDAPRRRTGWGDGGAPATQPTVAEPATPATAPLPAPARRSNDSSGLAALGLSPDPGPSETGAAFGSTGGHGDGYEKISVTGGEEPHRRYLPWLIVAIVAVIAVVTSVAVVLAVRGGGGTPSAAPGTQSPSAPSEEPSTEPTTPETTEPTEPAETPSDEVPKVSVGRTFDMPITQWNTTVDVSGKLGGGIRYQLDGDNMILLGGDLLPGFPEQCKAMRTGFGMTKQADGAFAVLRPAEPCADAKELYDEVWGLVAAMVDSARKS